MLSLPEKDSCCGCAACMDACAFGAIEMRCDDEGFMYPYTDAQKCVGCGSCVRSCPVLVPPEKNGAPKAFAAANLDDDMRRRSSSGGIFCLLAKSVLDSGGAVVGAAFDGDFSVRHILIEREEELPLLMGSKYVQSNTEGIYKETKEFLESGRRVLFSGVPCQTSALRSFLGKDHPGLLTVDILCHGAPSPLHWKKYLMRFSGGSRKIDSVSFRDKEHGWRRYSVAVHFSDGGTIKTPASEDVHMRAYLHDLISRPSCYSCRFRGESRPSDLTLADLWGAEKILGRPDDDMGASLVLVHSAKGMEAVEAIRGNIRIEPVDINKALSFNASALRSPEMPAERAAYMAGLKDGDPSQLEKKYCRGNPLERIKKAVKSLFADRSRT